MFDRSFSFKDQNNPPKNKKQKTKTKTKTTTKNKQKNLKRKKTPTKDSNKNGLISTPAVISRQQYLLLVAEHRTSINL